MNVQMELVKNNDQMMSNVPLISPQRHTIYSPCKYETLCLRHDSGLARLDEGLQSGSTLYGAYQLELWIPTLATFWRNCNGGNDEETTKCKWLSI